MAFKIHFDCIIIKRSSFQRIKEKSDANWFHKESYLQDDKIVVMEFMNSLEFDEMIEFLQSQGLNPLITENGIKKFNDFCVITFGLSGIEGFPENVFMKYPCDWIQIDKKKQLVSYINED